MTTWQRFRLDQCAEIVSGATPDTSDTTFWGGDICWATPKDLADLNDAFISDTPRKLSQRGLESCGASILPTESVLFSSRAPIGHVAINAVPMATNQGFKSFIPDRQKLDARFLYYWLRKHRPYLESLGNGATFKEVSKAIVSRIEIDLPPLPDQRRIADILDRADALRAQRRAAMAQLELLPQAIFLEMFGEPARNPKRYPRALLSDLIRNGDVINYGVVQPGNDVPDGVPVIRVGDLSARSIDVTSLKRISPEVEASHKRSRLAGDEILVSCVGTIGIVTLATPDLAGFNIARAVARVPLSNDVDRVFVAEYLRTEHVKRYFVNELRTVSQPTLNILQLGQTSVLVPPLAVQQAFANRAGDVSRLRATLELSLSELDALFASLQHRAFRGEL